MFALTCWSCRKNRLIRKIVNFKIYDVKPSLTIKYNTHITQYLNEIWPINRT